MQDHPAFRKRMSAPPAFRAEVELPSDRSVHHAPVMCGPFLIRSVRRAASEEELVPNREVKIQDDIGLERLRSSRDYGTRGSLEKPASRLLDTGSRFWRD